MNRQVMNETTKDLIEKITALTSEWYKLIGKDHHKDRDCHWSITTKWSYGEDPEFTVEHYGYILDHIEQSYPSYRAACYGLISMLERFVKEEKEKQEHDQWD